MVKSASASIEKKKKSTSMCTDSSILTLPLVVACPGVHAEAEKLETDAGERDPEGAHPDAGGAA